MVFEVQNNQLARDGIAIPSVPSPNIGGLLKPILLVIHYTATGPNSDVARYFATAGAKVSAHLVVRRDGSITQCVPFNTVAWHAGKSTWVCADGQVRSGLNQYAIGIEIENWGPLNRSPSGWLSWTSAPVDASSVIEARHKFGTPNCGWETYTEPQINAVIEASRAICSAYGITEIVGHDDISPGRKSDPGPAWNMLSFTARVFGRADDGDGALTVRSPSGLNLRAGAGAQFPLVRENPLKDGTRVIPHQAEGNWRYVSVLDAQGVPQERGWVNTAWLVAGA